MTAETERELSIIFLIAYYGAGIYAIADLLLTFL